MQLSETLIEKIKQGEFLVGDLLPSERKLSEMYELSRTTVRQALNYLETRGYISIQHGKGSFVVDHHKSMINLSEMYSFTEQMRQIGKTPQTILLDYSIVKPTEQLDEIFNKSENSYIRLVRLRLADEVPLLYEETYIPYSKFQSISAEEINKRALYDIFKEDYDEIVKYAQEEFSATIASEKEAEHLQIDTNSPVLNIFRKTINIKNEIIEYTESKARSDKFSYRTEHFNPFV